MKILKKFKKLIQEVANLVTSFFRPFGLNEKVLEIPKNLKRMGMKIGFLKLLVTLTSLVFAFLLRLANMAIEAKLILLGIILFMLYRGQQLVREAFWIFQSSENEKFDLIFNDEIVLKGSPIIGKVSNKVLKYDSTNKLYKLMDNESILNTIQKYLRNVWYLKTRHAFDILEMISIIIMLITAILTNNTISQFIFIPLVVVFAIISFFTTAYISLKRDSYHRENKELDNEQSVIVNDLLRVPNIVKDDLEMRIIKYQNSVYASNKNVRTFYKKLNLSNLFNTSLEMFSQYGIIIFYLLGVNWSDITIATIAEITATLAIMQSAIGYVGSIAGTFNMFNERLTIINEEIEDMSLIMDVYYQENEKSSKVKVVDNITINPFSIKYIEESENDKPFTLISDKKIEINKGHVVILTGPSGSGKSTFMKMLTERIKIEKSCEIPSTSRYLFYDEKLRFGSLSIYEELFCCKENQDHKKMQEILQNLHLWDEIKDNCFDIWKWMKQKKFEQALSNGQKQRLILAKMLYWLNDEIDVVVLDECTSGLDDKADENSADAERILEFIVKYCNRDKKRIIIIATHQNITGFMKKLEKEFAFKNLTFKREGKKNVIKELN